ncbi:hypothetical protein CDLVIII_2466 [Clostridium sp. DL-VIII]|nr:hypothetical protein CDLVIII_2466 [Clostridium sp. DL-VIII]
MIDVNTLLDIAMSEISDVEISEIFSVYVGDFKIL